MKALLAMSVFDTSSHCVCKHNTPKTRQHVDTSLTAQTPAVLGESSQVINSLTQNVQDAVTYCSQRPSRSYQTTPQNNYSPSSQTYHDSVRLEHLYVRTVWVGRSQCLEADTFTTIVHVLDNTKSGIAWILKNETK